MNAWLRQRWAAIWRLIGGVSLRIKIIGLAVAMIILVGLGLAWQARATMAHILVSDLSQQGITQALGDATRHILVTAVLLSLVGVAITIALTWLLIRPVLALAEAIRRAADGDLNQRLVPWADDEIGRSQASFNAMVEHLARSRQEMEATNRDLLLRNKELSVLYTISRDVAGPLGLAEVLERALQQTMGLVHTTGGWICLLGKDDFCQICVRSGEPSETDIGFGYCHKCDFCREARRTGQPLVVSPLPAECPLRAARSAESHAVVPLLVKERAVGLLNLVCEEGDCFADEDLKMLMDIGRQLGVAIENARLWEELRNKEALRGQLLRKIITAQEEERQRIARELHDEAGQALTSLLVGLRAIERADNLAKVHTLTADLRQVVAQTLDRVRDLALELRPRVLDDLGLIPALERYVSNCPAHFGFQAEFVTTGIDSQRLPPEVETTLYRIAQEALANVARHANAHHAGVFLQQREGAVVLVVEDDGVGFDVAQVMASSQERERLGLYGIEERASLVGGRLTVESGSDVGTTVSVEIPLERP